MTSPTNSQSYTTSSETLLGWIPANLPTNSEEWVMKITGVLITGMVVAISSPFWFNLQRIIAQWFNKRSQRELDAKFEQLGATPASEVQKAGSIHYAIINQYYQEALAQSRKSFWVALAAAVVGLAFFWVQ